MSQSPTILSIVLGVSALLAVYLAAWAHFHSRVPAAREFFFLMMGVAIYSFGYSVEIARTTLEGIFQAIRFEYMTPLQKRGEKTYPNCTLLKQRVS